MEKILKTSLILASICLVNFLNIFGLGLVISFLMIILLYFINISWFKYSLLLIPLIILSISFISKDYLNLFFWLTITYLIRILIYDITWNKSLYWIFFLALYISFFKINIAYSLFPLIFLTLTLPVFKIEFKEYKYVKILNIIFFILIIFSFLYCLYPEKIFSKRKSAFLIHGAWALPKPEYKIDVLKNQTIYSYSEFVKLINADTLNTVNNINNYNELWIVTPTKPFNKYEINKIYNWVNDGGHLILVSDHTDLYGHGRCINQLANKFNCKTEYSALFNKNEKELFHTSFGQNAIIKTGTAFEGSTFFPMISSFLWEECAYYGNENFFGPVTASGNDNYEDKVISCVKSKGLGQITFLGDSTFFANFSVYQPYTPNFISFLIMYHPFARLMIILPLIYLFILVLLYFKQIRITPLISMFFLLPISYVYFDNKLNWGENFQIWSGNSDFVFEKKCPYASISTAYSISPLSGKKPKWIDNVPITERNVIWLDTLPPKNSTWRWIKVKDKHPIPKFSSNEFKTLYISLGTPYIKDWKNSKDFKLIEVNSIFNDIVMNNWWYNDGISSSRLNRYKAWLSWLNQKEFPKPSVFNKSLFSKSTYDAVIRIDGKDPIYTKLRKPNANEGEIYLGEGISGKILLHKKTKSIIGFSQLTENWNAPSLWVIDYIN